MIALHCLAECCGILKGKAILTDLVAIFHPRALAASRGAAMPFVDKYEVVAKKRLSRDGLFP